MSALLFGSISTLADTSEIQREAFNKAFAQHGLDWQWDQEDYRRELTSNGGAQRIAAYAEQRGEQVDAAAVHASKSEIYQQTLAATDLSPRPGVVETLTAAKEQGLRVGLVTTTLEANLDALAQALAKDISFDSFDVITDLSDVEAGKPDPEAYTYALAELGVSAGDAVAVEDNVGGVQAASSAGIAVLAFPNENTAGHDFAKATQVVDVLSFDDVRGALGTGA